MKHGAALLGLIFAAQFGVMAGINWDAMAWLGGTSQSYIKQASTAATTREYDNVFGMDWDSVRTFRLMQPLSDPLKVYVETQRGDLYQPHYRDYVLQSLNAWSGALDGRLQYVLTPNRQQADIIVDWVRAFNDRYVAGITTYRVGHARIEIKTVGVPDKDIKANVLHEIGHALGIAGHSNHAGDIMVGMRRWQRDAQSAYNPQLSARDVQAIRRLYSPNWRRGEDLYSAMAQAAPVASRPQESAITPPSGQMPSGTAPSQQSTVRQRIPVQGYFSDSQPAFQYVRLFPDVPAPEVAP